MKKLNQKGFSHDLVAIAFVLIVAISGTAYMVASHALSNGGATVPVNSAADRSAGRGTKKDPVGKGVNRALALEAVKYDTKSTHSKYFYRWAGLHGKTIELSRFQNGGGADCSGFVRYVIWKTY